MKIILNEEDIKHLIMNSFDGVDEITMDKDINITLNVVKDKFSIIPVKTGIIARNVNEMSPPTEKAVRKLKVVKPKIATEKQKRLLEQAELMNQRSNDMEKSRTMSKANEQRNVIHVG